MEKKLRKISIVIAETGVNAEGEETFCFYLEGDVERLKDIDYDLMSSAEFWSLKFMEICRDVVTRAGALAKDQPAPMVKAPNRKDVH